jgi:hypothetical protein
MPEKTHDKPTIICLVGSTRFIERFAIKVWELEKQGNIVLGCTLLPQWYCPVADHFAEKIGIKEQIDELHLRKIDLADEVLVLNYGGYIGESTQREISYAKSIGRRVDYVQPLNLKTVPDKSFIPTGDICFVEADGKYYYRIVRSKDDPPLDITFGPFDEYDAADFDFCQADSVI